jgi:hypothetical protein
MRGIVKGLLAAAAVAALAVPAAGVALASEKPASQAHPSIIGGTNATETYSFMAALYSSDGWGCGASLIRPTWIITAEHCVTRDDGSASPGNTLTFRVGTVHHDSGGSMATGKRVIRFGSQGDTALVELTAPVPQTPINIASSAPVGSPIRIIGWGCTADPGCNGAEYLQQLDTSVLADSTCGGSQYFLCINNPDGSRGACYGDSGGPAVMKAGNSWVLAGDTSGGTSAICGQGPSVYGELPNLRSWIESYAGPDGGGTPPPPPPGGGTNVALNMPATSKQASCNASEAPAKAVNGSVSGGNSDKWCSAVAGAKSIQVDLGANKNLTKFVVKHAGAGGEAASLNTQNFILETSTGGGVWSTAATISNNTASTTTSAVTATARWIRLTTTDSVARIYEFEAY